MACRSSGYKYTPLGKSLDQKILQRTVNGSIVRYVLVSTTIAILAFLLGRYSATPVSLHSWSNILNREPLSTLQGIHFQSSPFSLVLMSLCMSLVPTNEPSPFFYDHRFGQPPSNSSNAAWKTLFPKQGGFFRHPQLAPERSAFAAFHQLHCLDGLRRAVWKANPECDSGYNRDAPESGVTHEHDGSEKREIEQPQQGSVSAEMDMSSTPAHDHAEHAMEMTDPAHLRHCIDLLRQTLMCNPDLTVEVSNKELGGVTGFGTVHRCVNWGSLMTWTKNWEGWGQTG